MLTEKNVFKKYSKMNLRIASMAKDGYTVKEIASLLHLRKTTVTTVAGNATKGHYNEALKLLGW